MIDNEVDSRRGTPSVYPALPPSPFQYLTDSPKGSHRKELNVKETSSFTSLYRSPNKSLNSATTSYDNQTDSPSYTLTKTSNIPQQSKLGTPVCNSSHSRSHEDHTLNGSTRRSILRVSKSPHVSGTLSLRPSVSFAKKKEIVTFSSSKHRESCDSNESDVESIALNPRIQKVSLSPLSEKPQGSCSSQSSPCSISKERQSTHASPNRTRTSIACFESLFLPAQKIQTTESRCTSPRHTLEATVQSPLYSESPWMLPSMDDITRQSCNTPSQNKRTSLLSTVQSPVPMYCFRERLSLTSDVGNSVLPLRNDLVQENSLTSVCLEKTRSEVAQDLNSTSSAQPSPPKETPIENTIKAPLMQKKYDVKTSPIQRKKDSIVVGSPFHTNEEDSNRFSSVSDSFTIAKKSEQFRSDIDDEMNFSSCSSNHKILRELTPLASRRKLSSSSESSSMSDFSFDVTKERSFSEQEQSQKNYSPFHTVENLRNTEKIGSLLNESVKVPRLSLASLYNYDSSNELTNSSPDITHEAANSETVLKDPVLKPLGTLSFNIKKLSETKSDKVSQATIDSMPDCNNPQRQHHIKIASRRRTCDKSIECMKKQGVVAGGSLNGQQLFTPRTARRTIGPIKVSQGGIWERLENGADRMTPRPQDFNPTEIRLSSTAIGSSQKWNYRGFTEEKYQHRKSTMITSINESSPHIKYLQEKNSKSYLLKQKTATRQSYASLSSADRLPPISVEFLETPSHYVSNILIVDGEEDVKSKAFNSINSSSNQQFFTVSGGLRQKKENSIQTSSLVHENSPIRSIRYFDNTKRPESYTSYDIEQNQVCTVYEKSFKRKASISALENESDAHFETEVPSNNYSIAGQAKQTSFPTPIETQRRISTSVGGLSVKRSLDSSLPPDLIQRPSNTFIIQDDVQMKHKEYERNSASDEAPTLLDSSHRLRKTDSSLVDLPLQNVFEENKFTVKNVPVEAAFKIFTKNSLSKIPTQSNTTDTSKVENNAVTEFGNRKSLKQQQWSDPKVKISSKRATLLPKIVHTLSTPTKTLASSEHTNNSQGTCSFVNSDQGVLKNLQEAATSSVKNKEVFSFPEKGVDWNTCFAIQRLTLSSQYFSPPYLTLEQLSQQAFDVTLQKTQETENNLSPSVVKGHVESETLYVQKHLINGTVNGDDNSEKMNFTLHYGSLEDNFTPEHVAALIDWLEKRSLCAEKIPKSTNVKLVAILDYLRHDPDFALSIIKDGVKHLLSTFTTKASVESWEEVLKLLVQFWPERLEHVHREIEAFPNTLLSRYQCLLMPSKGVTHTTSQHYSFFMDHIFEREELAAVLALGHWKLNIALPSHFGALERLQATATDLHKAVQQADLVLEKLGKVQAASLKMEPDNGIHEAQKTLQEQLKEAVALEKKQVERFSKRQKDRQEYTQMLDKLCLQTQKEIEELNMQINFSNTYVENGQAAVQLIVLQRDFLEFEQFQSSIRLYDVELDYIEIEILPERYQAMNFYNLWNTYLNHWVTDDLSIKSIQSSENVAQSTCSTKTFQSWERERKELFEALEEAEIEQDSLHVHQPENRLLQALALPPLPKVQVWWRYEEQVLRNGASHTVLVEGLKLRIHSGLSDKIEELFPEQLCRPCSATTLPPVVYLHRRFLCAASEPKIPIGLGPLYFDWFIRQRLYSFVENYSMLHIQEDLKLKGFPYISPVQKIFDDCKSIHTECVPLTAFVPGVGIDNVLALASFVIMHCRQIDALMVQHRILYSKYHPVGFWGPESAYFSSNTLFQDPRVRTSLTLNDTNLQPYKFDEDHIVIHCLLKPSVNESNAIPSCIESVTILLVITVRICLIFGSFVHGIRPSLSGVMLKAPTLTPSQLEETKQHLNDTLLETLKQLTAETWTPTPDDLSQCIHAVENETQRVHSF
ncbi:uncharacterized protein LOC128883013 isoform X2 [Hylaeus volcanicus]|uniref:uncharacterized protein LOC128883013 isoform X2 n=1 Tax=Hylaeus volcanicus TaxID=313075 RepID=UPI0023B7FB21|nr:uncharacterized protein LOC128883013 isoform X2 [Hylaeus volcanicus]